MFFYVAIIMGAVAVIQCKPLDDVSTTVDYQGLVDMDKYGRWDPEIPEEKLFIPLIIAGINPDTASNNRRQKRDVLGLGEFAAGMISWFNKYEGPSIA